MQTVQRKGGGTSDAERPEIRGGGEMRRFQPSNRTYPSAAGVAPAIVHEVLQSSGQPLDATTRAYFEPRFGYNSGNVRVTVQFNSLCFSSSSQCPCLHRGATHRLLAQDNIHRATIRHVS